MKLELTKDWCMNMATNEQLADIVAAVPDIGDKPAREMTIARMAYSAAGRNLHFECQHGAEEPADTAQRLAVVQELQALRELVGLAYGHLWCVNNEHGTPANPYLPERAAYEARKLLRDTMTHEQRGVFINRVVMQVFGDLGPNV